MTDVKAEEITPFGAITPGVTGDGTYGDPYNQSSWNGRIESTENLHDNYYAYISIDVRDGGMFFDDALVAFNYYYLNARNNKVAVSLPSITAELIFSDKKGSYGKSADTNDGENWEYLVSAGKFGINRVIAVITINDGNYSKTIYYQFGY